MSTNRSPGVDHTADVTGMNWTGQDKTQKDWITNIEMQKMMVKAFSPYNLPANNNFKRRHKSVPFKGHVNLAYLNQDMESSLMQTSAFNDM